MSDLLSASSLLMAIVAILFSLWYPEIMQALDIAPREHPEDNILALNLARAVLFAKALPVAAMAVSVALIFAPDAIRITSASLAAYLADPAAAIRHYDAVQTAYCLVSMVSLALACYMCVLARALLRLMRRLRRRASPMASPLRRGPAGIP